MAKVYDAPRLHKYGSVVALTATPAVKCTPGPDAHFSGRTADHPNHPEGWCLKDED